MAINYYTSHIRKKQASFIMPKHHLQKGMIVQTRYRNKDNKSKQYMFLCLNSEYNGMVHLLSLNEMSPNKLNDLARITGLKAIPSYIGIRGIDFEKLLILESSNRFYLGKLKGKMKTKWGSSYRTFIAKNLSTLTLVDYKWDNDIPIPPAGTTIGQLKKVPPYGKTRIPKDYDGRTIEDIE